MGFDKEVLLNLSGKRRFSGKAKETTTHLSIPLGDRGFHQLPFPTQVPESNKRSSKLSAKAPEGVLLYKTSLSLQVAIVDLPYPKDVEEWQKLLVYCSLTLNEVKAELLAQKWRRPPTTAQLAARYQMDYTLLLDTATECHCGRGFLISYLPHIPRRTATQAWRKSSTTPKVNTSKGILKQLKKNFFHLGATQKDISFFCKHSPKPHYKFALLPFINCRKSWFVMH